MLDVIFGVLSAVIDAWTITASLKWAVLLVAIGGFLLVAIMTIAH